MITMLANFKTENGFDLDSYYKALIENGEECIECGKAIYPPRGIRARCLDCDSFEDDDDEVTHSRCVRCPECGGKIDPDVDGIYELFNGGDHDVSCEQCGCDFTVSTHVSYLFTSPPRIKK